MFINVEFENCYLCLILVSWSASFSKEIAHQRHLWSLEWWNLQRHVCVRRSSWGIISKLDWPRGRWEHVMMPVSDGLDRHGTCSYYRIGFGSLDTGLGQLSPLNPSRKNTAVLESDQCLDLSWDLILYFFYLSSRLFLHPSPCSVSRTLISMNCISVSSCPLASTWV